MNIQSEPILHLCIPTFNRAHLLEMSLNSLQQQANDNDRWRVLVVNNNSTDDTQQRLQRLQQQWARLNVVFENQQGSAIARNRGLAECRKGWILYIDDDCTFPSDYVDRALDVIDRYAPAMFGGPCYPRYDHQPPYWWRDDYGIYSHPKLTGRSNRISLSGGNICFALDALQQIGGFDPRLGIHGKRLGFGEETAVEAQILHKYPPEAIQFDLKLFVYHLVRAEKYQWSFLLHEHLLRGIARARIRRLQATLTEATGQPIAPPSLLVTNYQPPQAKRNWHPLGILYENGLPLVRLLGFAVGYLCRL